ncbi:hypothetical protein NKR19_g4866 [Coniochaeta hoffmannii]|uniref:Uncharacterized protein n=1 Tax=Coniochaeta hoffmannii TaxID=91930 RepID=A0AA38VMG8_9PEZI|nr:hypothetical protein NKR19_g4866 [Coniochaeta hoffmannii]
MSWNHAMTWQTAHSNILALPLYRPRKVASVADGGSSARNIDRQPTPDLPPRRQACSRQAIDTSRDGRAWGTMSENLAARLHKHTLARCSQPSAIVEDKSSRRSRGTYTEEEATPSYLQDTATILGLERSRGAFCRWAAPIKDACPNPAKILWDREIVHPTSATAPMASRLPTRTKVKDDGDESSPPPPPSRGGWGAHQLQTTTARRRGLMLHRPLRSAKAGMSLRQGSPRQRASLELRSL